MDTIVTVGISGVSAAVGTELGIAVGLGSPVAGVVVGMAIAAIVGGLIGWGLQDIKTWAWKESILSPNDTDPL